MERHLLVALRLLVGVVLLHFQYDCDARDASTEVSKEIKRVLSQTPLVLGHISSAKDITAEYWSSILSELTNGDQGLTFVEPTVQAESYGAQFDRYQNRKAGVYLMNS